MTLWLSAGESIAQPASSPDGTFERGGQNIPMRVVGQAFFGVVGGVAGGILVKVHPVLGGVGWTVGSAFGVYAIGDRGSGRGSYWWTFAGGAATVLAFTPAMSKGGLGGGFAVGYAALTSLIAEIVVYHLTEKDQPQKVNVWVTPSAQRWTRESPSMNQSGWTLTVQVLL